MVVPTPDGEHNQLVLAPPRWPASTACSPSAARRPSARSPTAPRPCRRWTRSSARQCLRRRRQAPRLRHRRHRHGRRPVGNPRRLRWFDQPGLGRDGPFSQAEHDELAQSILVCPDDAYIDRVAASIEKLLPTMPRRGGDRGLADRPRRADPGARHGRSLCHRQPHRAGASRTLDQDAEQWCRRSATPVPSSLAPTPRNRSATTVPARIMCCRPPARRASLAAGRHDFQKRSSLIRVSQAGAQTLGKIASTLAHGGGLPAHAKSAEFRLD